MWNEQIIKSIKITLGVVVAILIAKALDMEFYTSAGTIVIVCMLSAKKQSFKLSATRLVAAVISLSLSSLLFFLFGFSLPVLALYILIFTLLMYRFDTVTAIVINVVLVMHIYSLAEISFPILLNEFYLISLGVAVALVFNYYSFDIEKELIEYQRQVEDAFHSIFENIGLCLVSECKTNEVTIYLDQLKDLLSLAKERSYKYMNRYYIQNNNYYVEYFFMRKQQYHVVNNMQKFLNLSFLNKSEGELLKSFTDNFLYNTNVLISCESQIEKLEEIRYQFNNTSLPTSQEELQNRIALNQYLAYVEELITLRIGFIERFDR